LNASGKRLNNGMESNLYTTGHSHPIEIKQLLVRGHIIKEDTYLWESHMTLEEQIEVQHLKFASKA